MTSSIALTDSHFVPQDALPPHMALAQFLCAPLGLQLDRITRQFLLFAWACQQDRVNTAEAYALAQASGTAYPEQLSVWLESPAPRALASLCAILEEACRSPSHGSAGPVPGLLVTLEGGDGSGKTTQTRKLAEALAAAGYDAVTARAIGGSSDAALALREFILNPDYSWNSLAEGLLTISIYREALVQVILPALEKGRIVVCDRLIDTLSVYLCDHSIGLTPEIFGQLFNILVADRAPGLMPDMTFLLDLPAEEAMERRNERQSGRVDRNEAKSAGFHDNVFLAYRKLALAEPRIVSVNAAMEPEELTACLLAKVIEKMQQGESA